MATSPVFGWPLPDSSDLVRDLPADFDAFSDALEATLADTVLQVVTVAKTDTFTLSADQAFTAVTGLELNITPASTSSRIIVLANVATDYTTGGSGGPNIGRYTIYRNDTTNLADPGSPGNRVAVLGVMEGTAEGTVNMTIIDSPNTTSAVNYQVYVSTSKTTLNALYINRSNTDTDNNEYWRGVSTITAIELAS